MGISHFSFDLSARYQRGHRVNHNNINGAASDQHVRDFKCLLARIRLGHKQIIAINTEFFRICGVKGMLGVYKRCDTILFLRFSYRMQGQGGFAESGRSAQQHVVEGVAPAEVATWREKEALDAFLAGLASVLILLATDVVGALLRELARLSWLDR